MFPILFQLLRLYNTSQHEQQYCRSRKFSKGGGVQLQTRVGRTTDKVVPFLNSYPRKSIGVRNLPPPPHHWIRACNLAVKTAFTGTHVYEQSIPYTDPWYALYKFWVNACIGYSPRRDSRLGYPLDYSTKLSQSLGV